jgi:two-component system nitrate/nitrite sensor histidine kinase NarX
MGDMATKGSSELVLKASPRMGLPALSSRWVVSLMIGTALVVFLCYMVFQDILFASLPRGWQALVWALVFVVLFAIGLALSGYMRSIQQRLAEAERRLQEADQRQEAIFRLGQNFVAASDENQVVEPILRLLVDLTGAQGATFVPLDEHGQPQTVLSYGALPAQVMEGWGEYLSSEAVRTRCQNCKNKEPFERPLDCPLLKGPFINAAGIFCASARRGEREFGIINLFLADSVQFDEGTRMFLRALVDGVALGLESVHLRRREFTALRQMQVLRQKTDLTVLLNGLLENVCRALEADFVVMALPQGGPYLGKIDLVYGDFYTQARPIVESILQEAMTSKEPVLIGEVVGEQAGIGASLEIEKDLMPGVELRSLVAAPLLGQERNALGAILAGVRGEAVIERHFHQRHAALLQVVAGQLALIVQNADLMADLEYKTMIQERARLAREIHDGLAQTIGFLKLQAAQLRKSLGRGEIDRLRQSADMFYTTLSETYQDARQAIDDLRISPGECGFVGWLTQVCNEFQELSGLPLELVTPDNLYDVDKDLPPEVHAQLLRIVQEALSNVRKHARATRVKLVVSQDGDDLTLEVRDDGVGFSPADLPSSSRHGLQGMRERAELVGADFQVISSPQNGTLVRMRLPMGSLQIPEVGP